MAMNLVLCRNLAIRTPKPWVQLALNSIAIRPAVCRLISTGSKDGPKKAGLPPADPRFGGDADIFINPDVQKRPPGPKTVEDFADVAGQKNWISYGFDSVYMKEDRWLMHVSFFSVVTMVFCGVGYIMYNYPDKKLDAWASREAYLEIHRRKKLGLPTIDRNYVDPRNVVLPTEEEIGDLEIIL